MKFWSSSAWLLFTEIVLPKADIIGKQFELGRGGGVPLMNNTGGFGVAKLHNAEIEKCQKWKEFLEHNSICLDYLDEALVDLYRLGNNTEKVFTLE